MQNLSNHNIFEGTIYHKRFLPKKHDFKYNFYLLDIDVFDLKSLENRIFSINKLNFMSLLKITQVDISMLMKMFATV